MIFLKKIESFSFSYKETQLIGLLGKLFHRVLQVLTNKQFSEILKMGSF